MPALFSREEIETSRQVAHLLLQNVAMSLQDQISDGTLKDLSDVPVWLVDMAASMYDIPLDEWMEMIEASTRSAIEDEVA